MWCGGVMVMVCVLCSEQLLLWHVAIYVVRLLQIVRTVQRWCALALLQLRGYVQP